MKTPENSPVDITILEAPGVRAIIFPDGDSVISDDSAKEEASGHIPKKLSPQKLEIRKLRRLLENPNQ